MRERVVVIGGGIAGLATALQLAPMPVTLLTKARLGDDAATSWAQGGIAAALGPDDAPEHHAADTLAAGAGLCDADIAARVTAAAPASVEDLLACGVPFDRDAAQALALGLEAAHSRRRIVHAAGDGTGRVVMAALINAARRAPAIEVIEGACATALTVHNDRVIGVRAALGAASRWFSAQAVVLATGGVGGLYADTTNPLGAIGSGLVLAARAGAVLRDMEFVQFHPTAMALGQDPMPLATEALRGEGAMLVNGRGERFMATVPGRELAPRDVVARAIACQIAAGEKVYLDARATIGKRFPSVAALCRAAGLDPLTMPIPVRPAAHYHMGGVAVDGRGRTTVDALWACGEVAATGFHGANRLASNSLLEALAFARWIAADIVGRAVQGSTRHVGPDDPLPAEPPCPARWAEIRALMTAEVGVTRDEVGLRRAIGRLAEIAQTSARSRGVADMALVALFIATAALTRRESRGAHFRGDCPTTVRASARPIELTLPQAERIAAELLPAA